MEALLDLSKPLEILYCWQALVVAVTAAGIVRLIKATIDSARGEGWRKERKWIEIILFPSLAVLFGAVTAVLLPLRPDVLDEYLAKVPEREQWAIPYVYALWGGACGQFSSWIYDRVISILRAGAPLLDRALNTVKKVAKGSETTSSAAAEELPELDDSTDDPGRPLDR